VRDTTKDKASAADRLQNQSSQAFTQNALSARPRSSACAAAKISRATANPQELPRRLNAAHES